MRETELYVRGRQASEEDGASNDPYAPLVETLLVIRIPAYLGEFEAKYGETLRYPNWWFSKRKRFHCLPSPLLRLFS